MVDTQGSPGVGQAWFGSMAQAPVHPSPAAWISATTASTPSERTSTTATFARSSAKRCAVARPIPLAAPVTNATLPFALKIANLGCAEAVRSDPHLLQGVNTFDGHITYQGVADAFGMPCRDVEDFVLGPSQV